jgi:hypothetical protein
MSVKVKTVIVTITAEDGELLERAPFYVEEDTGVIKMASILMSHLEDKFDGPDDWEDSDVA